MEPFYIREAKPEDALEIIQYLKEVGGQSDYLTFGPEGLPVTPQAEAAMLEHKHKEVGTVIYLAHREGKLMGVGSLDGMPRRMSHRSELGLTVLRQEWNKGVGSALMNQLLNYAKNNGIELIYLETAEENQRAIHLYEKYGFSKVGHWPGFFKLGDRYLDFVGMVLDLRPGRCAKTIKEE